MFSVISKVKKPVAAVVAALFCISLVGCSEESIRTGSSEGYSGKIVLSAELVDGGFLLAVEESSESVGIGDIALEETVKRMNGGQTLAVDAMSGATVTSLAARQAAEKALLSVGLDPDDYCTRNENINIEYLYDDCDICIVGAGGAGLTAAVIAAEQGADVLVLEKMSIVGGSTARSGGKLMACNTDFQKKNLINDTDTQFASFLCDCSSGLIESDRLVSLAEHSSEMINGLISLGVPFSDTLGKTSDGVERVFTVSDGETESGGLLLKPLYERALELGVRIMTDTEVTELTTAPTGAVNGVRALVERRDTLIVDAKAVILATGGFDRNEKEIKKLYDGEVLPQSGLGNTGGGITLAEEVGAEIIEDISLAAEFYDPCLGLSMSNGILVTDDGVRFCDESGDLYEMFQRLLRRDSRICYLITDDIYNSSALEAGIKSEKIIEADSASELAEKLGMDAVPNVIGQYNKLCETGNDAFFGRDPDTMKPIDGDKLYAIKCGITVKASIGGIKINRSGEAINEDGAIPGLYAAGELVSGNFFADTYPGDGAMLTVTIYTAQTAAESAISFIKAVS